MRFDQVFLKGVIPDIEIISEIFPQEISFAVDSRQVKAGDVFVALSGAKTDGHNFIGDALENGAAGLLIASTKKHLLEPYKAQLKNALVMAVENPTTALLKLATAWRAQFSYHVVGITGSVGKTSTKEIIRTILKGSGIECVATVSSQNTRIGIAINIFKMRSHHKVAIFEMGISRRGEMMELVRLVRPTTAIITGIGHAHMEGLGSLSDIAVEKRDIFKFFTEQSIGIINGDQTILSNVAYTHPVIKFGSKTTNQVQARKVNINGQSTTFVLKLYKEKHRITIAHAHEGSVFNALAATAVCYLLQVPSAAIIKGLQVSTQVTGRFESRPLTHFQGSLIHDCFNANPESMKAALLAFQKIETGAQKIAVLGDMLELGINAPFWHRQLGRFLRKVPSLNHLILVGDMTKWTQKTVPVTVSVDWVATWQEAAAKLESHLQKETVVLVKGSRGVALDKLVDTFTQNNAATVG